MLQNEMQSLDKGCVKKIERLWRNHKRYCGETIDIDEVQGECVASALAHGWRLDPMGSEGDGSLQAFVRPARKSPEKAPNLYISAGIHGDEPAGPLAAEMLLKEDRWPAGLNLWICPCLNPEGFELNTRENQAGIDLNRQYLHPKVSQIVDHIRWLNRQPYFDTALCLHEDWESNGFYVYELNPDNKAPLAERIVTAVATVCPVDNSPEIEGRPAKGGIIRPKIDLDARKDWPEAFYLIRNKTRLSCTLEAPSDFPLEVRLRALVEGVNAACAALQRS